MRAAKTLLQNRYEIVRPIAQSEMGAVYEGRDWRLGGSAVALKLCVFDTEEARDVFEREANQLAYLSHQNLPQVRDFFRAGAGQYLVTEFVPGNDLEETMRKFGDALDYRTVLTWADQLLDTLVYLHQIEPPVIHRDIKPINIKLTPQGHVMLLDFGFAKEHCGNPGLYDYASAYVPIEQIQNSGTDARSDLYALGATLFRLLTGRLPANVLARLEANAIRQPDPQKLASDIVPAVPLLVSQAVHRALALDGEARFQSAVEMRAALRLALKTAPPLEQNTMASLPATDTIQTGTIQAGIEPESFAYETTHPFPARPGAPQPAFVKPASVTQTTTVPVPPAYLVQPRTYWQVVMGLFVLLIGGTSMGLLAQQFLGRSSAELPGNAVRIPAAPRLPQQFTNRFGARFILVAAGKFMMGSLNESNAQPPHMVVLTQPFYLSTHEITQQQWRSLMRNNPSEHKGDNLPVENVSWFDAQKFVAQINLMNDGYRYRLPTEAEWEFAARAGSAEDVSQDLSRYAWFNANAQTTQPVGLKEPNAFGLHDMLGNVAEWCADAYHETYAGTPTNGEAWTAASGDKLFRVIRGASWFSPAEKLHAAFRNYDEPQKRNGMLGFRIVAEKMPETASP